MVPTREAVSTCTPPPPRPLSIARSSRLPRPPRAGRRRDGRRPARAHAARAVPALRPGLTGTRAAHAAAAHGAPVHGPAAAAGPGRQRGPLTITGRHAPAAAAPPPGRAPAAPCRAGRRPPG